jgi:septum formation protein
LTPHGPLFHTGRMNRPADPIALASRSPRRYQLLCAAGYQVTVIEGALEPAAPTEGEAAEVARAQAWAKMPATSTDRLVIAADTVVVVDRQVLGKPVDGADAVRMLSALSGRTHAELEGRGAHGLPSRRGTLSPT